MGQFSDEFNKPGRTFYPDDDPYWEGADIWYGVTEDVEVRILVVSPSDLRHADIRSVV